MDISHDQSNPASRIADRIGRKVIAEKLGVRPTAVSNAVVAGAFPPRWFLIIEAACAEFGVECPREAFSFLPNERDAA